MVATSCPPPRARVADPTVGGQRTIEYLDLTKDATDALGEWKSKLEKGWISRKQYDAISEKLVSSYINKL
jgi:hypothetical protein